MKISQIGQFVKTNPIQSQYKANTNPKQTQKRFAVIKSKHITV
jgi:hypothetical protein